MAEANSHQEPQEGFIFRLFYRIFFFIDGNDKEQLLVRELQVVPNGMAEEVRFLCDFLSHRVQLNKQ